MIQVNKPFLPPREEYEELVRNIWQREWLTNDGPLVKQLEAQLMNYLKEDHLLFLTNGTVALQIAIKALDLRGKVITTPFSYVATTSSLVWEGCEPVFADIDPHTFNIDPDSIEALITPDTTGILATHVYGNPCNIERIAAIAHKHGLKVIYDAAHCFGTLYKGRSVFGFGDISTTSFHATKVFHTVEGGAVFCNDPALYQKMRFQRNFGHNGPIDFAEIGINGKNSEFHAAMGLVNLNYIDAILERRKQLFELYMQQLEGLELQYQVWEKDSVFNYSYMPIVFPDEKQLLATVDTMLESEIFPRRYFYPALNDLSYVKHGYTPVCDDISRRVLCLPLYFALQDSEVEAVAGAIHKSFSTILK